MIEDGETKQAVKFNEGKSAFISNWRYFLTVGVNVTEENHTKNIVMGEVFWSFTLIPLTM